MYDYFCQELSVLVFPREGLVQSILTGKSGRGEAPKTQPGVAKAQTITGMWMQSKNCESMMYCSKKTMNMPCGWEYLLLINRYCCSGVSADKCLWGTVCEASRRICNKQFSQKKKYCVVCVYMVGVRMFSCFSIRVVQNSCFGLLSKWSYLYVLMCINGTVGFF